VRAERRLNEGSRARDHLANERTFLAWVRTALGGVALGIAIERFGTGDDNGTDLAGIGLAFVLSSMALLGYATWRYLKVESDLEEGYFTVDRIGPAVLALAVMAIAAVAAVLVIA